MNLSKALNNSQQLINKKEISKILTITEQTRPNSEKIRRPWTSRDSVMRNNKIS